MGGDFELLCVDDGSPDEAWNILSEIAQTDHRVKAIRLSRNFGQHPAIAAGFEHATGDVIILMDADLQDRPEDIPLLYSRLVGDIDIVYTVRRSGNGQFKWTSRLYHFVFSRLTGTKIPENIGTMRLFSRTVLEALRKYPERNVLYGPLMFFVGFRFSTVEVDHAERPQGRSSYTFSKRLALAFNSLMSYTDLPHRLVRNTGMIVSLFSAVYALAILIRWLTGVDGVPPGLTLLALLLTFTLGATMFSLGIVGTYVYRVYQEVLQRPRYIVARSINLLQQGTRP
jgi:dolichol-phosphate mannosyltransferase